MLNKPRHFLMALRSSNCAVGMQHPNSPRIPSDSLLVLSPHHKFLLVAPSAQRASSRSVSSSGLHITGAHMITPHG